VSQAYRLLLLLLLPLLLLLLLPLLGVALAHVVAAVDGQVNFVAFVFAYGSLSSA
jgi:hypothetical protein